MDFFVMFSSNNTLMGIPGQGDYTAGNTYLNSFADFANTDSRVTTINWPQWKETGMAFEHGTNKDSIFKAISTQQAITAFDMVLNMDIRRIIIGELNYSGSLHGKTLFDANIKVSEEINRTLNNKISKKKPTNQELNSNQRKDQEIKLKGNAKFSQVEKTIAGIWHEVLGFEEINVHDNFFEIGGDSILVTRVHSLLEESYTGKVSMADLFTYNTISKLSKYIEDENPEAPFSESADQNSSNIEDDISKLLEDLENGNLDINAAIDSYSKL
jgi:acyl carrier protein